ncbi:chemotaxis protein CheW [Halorussus gelatinilyticus]|uniref:Chemotaxis protein CheW n=1 Tax=Halorussus gelatinilyticus TaxID=2937524 RepID=A0A8U0IEI4_9EURY|nr:chemotaxis protein CheW [Halorussus gelatinilyticus]UPV99479.1 chemotaxis protein CheW [Halorussus gelatinilyticus]
MSGEIRATTPETTEDRREWVEFVRFPLGDHAYGLELGRVEQIVPDPDVTPVPQTGPAIAGVTNLGSEIPVVVDARALLGLTPGPDDAEPTLLVLDRDDDRPTGLLVEAVTGIDAHHVDTVAAPHEAAWDPPVGRRWFRAVVEDSERADRPIGVLDLDVVVDNARDQS